MRVVQIHTRYRQQGGEDNVVDSEFDLLSQAGHELARYQRVNPLTPVAAAAAMAAAVWNRRAAADAGDVIDAFRPDIVHVHNTWFAMTPAVIDAAHRRTPVVMTLHNYRLQCANAQLFRDGHTCRLCVDGSLWNGVIHNCYRDPLSSAIAAATIGFHRNRTWRHEVDLFLVLSKFASHLLSESGVTPEKIVVKDNFVSDPGPRPLPPSASERILFVGRLSAEKGILPLLQNRQVFEKCGLTLIVAGDGPLRAQVATALAENYLGPQAPAEIYDLMLTARALVMPSLWYEGQPRTALEAFSTGLAVLGSGRGGTGELLSELGPSWIFDPDALWEPAVTRLADDDFVNAGGAAARALFDKRFSPPIAIANLERAYRLASQRHQEAC